MGTFNKATTDLKNEFKISVSVKKCTNSPKCVCCRFAKANGEFRAQEPKAEGGVSAENPGVPHSLLRPNRISDRYYN